MALCARGLVWSIQCPGASASPATAPLRLGSCRNLPGIPTEVEELSSTRMQLLCLGSVQGSPSEAPACLTLLPKDNHPDDCRNYRDNHVFCLQSNGTWDDLGLRASIGDDNHCAVQQVPNPVTATGKDDIYQDHIPRLIWMDQKEGNLIHLFCPFYSPNLEIRRISHGETNISKADNGAEFPLKFLLLIWSRLYSLLPSVSSSVEHPSERHIQQKSHRHQTRTLFTAQHQGHKGQKGKERTRQHQICAATCCVGLRRYFSPGHWHRVQESGKKNIPASQRAPVPHQCVRNEKKILLYHIFSTSLGLSKEQGTWKQLFIESTAVSRRLGWEEQEEIHKLHFLPDLVL